MGGLILALLAAPAVHAACPDLAGRYVCNYREGRDAKPIETAVVSQTLEGDVVVYRYNGSELRADNVERPVADDGEIRQGRLRVWCDDQGVVRGRLWARYFESGNYSGDLELFLSYVRVGTELRQTSAGRLIATDHVVPLGSQTACARLR